jgi:hypothetical protein
MWTMARAAAELTPKLERDAYKMSLAFKKPVFLPSTAHFGYTVDQNGAEFALNSSSYDVLHLCGDIRYI